MFELPPLDYAYDALVPYIDEETMHIHHDKHHQKYVDDLNRTLQSYPEYYDKTIEELVTNISTLPLAIQKGVRNFGGGHFNHSFFWESLSPISDTEPTGELKAAIIRDFGSMENFKGQFKQIALQTFGSGWTWLVKDPTGTLQIISIPNQDTPLEKGLIPLLTIDLWEHAYYLKYQNKRAEYIDAFFHVINWERVEQLYNM